MCCAIEDGENIVLIDPGVALGYRRSKLYPHPLQAAFGEIAKIRIVAFWMRATHIVISHPHGDHMPLYNANPFQLPLDLIKDLNSLAKVYVCAYALNTREARRLNALANALRGRVMVVDRPLQDDVVVISGPYKHGVGESFVFAAIVIGAKVFVHLSDTQLLVDDVVELLRSWRPHIVFTDGPPIYRYDSVVKEKMLRTARKNLEKILKYADKVIIDHHILRCTEGFLWLDTLAKEFSNCIMCGADYMGMPRLPLEAWRSYLYRVIPTDNRWFHNGYKGVGEALNCLRDLVEALVLSIPRGVLIEDPTDILIEFIRRSRSELLSKLLSISRSELVNAANRCS